MQREYHQHVNSPEFEIIDDGVCRELFEKNEISQSTIHLLIVECPTGRCHLPPPTSTQVVDVGRAWSGEVEEEVATL